jgi:hypothetical protein
MAKLSTKARKALPRSAFAYPEQRRYPIHDAPHARLALAQSARKDTFGSYGHVKAKVQAKFPSIGKAKRRGTR